MSPLPATLPHPTSEIQTRWAAVLARWTALGPKHSQNRLARRLRKDAGHFSRVVRGERPSLRLLQKAERTVALEEVRRIRRFA